MVDGSRFLFNSEMGVQMKTESLTAEDLEYIKCMCEASNKAGLDWARAVSLFPALTEQEKHWKNRMLLGIRLVGGEAPKTMPALQSAPGSQTLV
jgi:hypothetical protein